MAVAAMSKEEEDAHVELHLRVHDGSQCRCIVYVRAQK